MECRVGVYGEEVRRVKIWEKQMERWLDEAGLIWSHSQKKLSCALTIRFPDYLFVTPNGHVVLLEVDENQHSGRDKLCEIARISEIMDSISHANLHVIRYNPHGKGETEDKKKEVIAAIREACAHNLAKFSDSGCVVQYIGYTQNRVVMLDQLTCDLQEEGLSGITS